MRTAEEFARWADDLRHKRGTAHRDYLRDYHPEFDNTPDDLIPWPYRPAEAVTPVFCPKCGRALIHYWWSDAPQYHEVACCGRLNLLMRVFPGLLFLFHHWQITIGRADVTRGQLFDHASGEPMDGPR